MRDLPHRRLRLCAAIALIALGGLLGGCRALPGIGPAREANFEPSGPAVVAFAAPFDPVRDPRSPDAYAASVTGLRVVLGQLADCAALPHSDVHLILADRVRVHTAGIDTTIEASAPGVVLLMDRGRAPQHAALGPAPHTEPRRLAARYFDAPGCLPQTRGGR